MVEPASRGIHQSSGIQLPDPSCQLKFGIVACDLAPTLVINNLWMAISSVHLTITFGLGFSYPCGDAREALMLVDQQLQLTPKFDLLSIIGQDSLPCAIRESPALKRSQ